MPTVINNPSVPSAEGGMGVGVIIGIIFAILIVAVIFFMYGLPAIQGDQNPAPSGTNINVQLPPTPLTPPAETPPAE